MNEKDNGRFAALDRTGRQFICRGSVHCHATNWPRLSDRSHTSLASLRQERQPSLVPAVAVAESVKPDYLVCLEDGLRFRTLKRHLAVAYGMTPEEYRAKWHLPLQLPDGGAQLFPRLRSARLPRNIRLGGSKP